MNPILDIVVALAALIAGGVVFDWRVRRRHGQSHDITAAQRAARGAAESRGAEGGRGRRGSSASGHARAAGPRLAICAAMIDRWTSLVPSQMRSTRSSRKKRSATFSRM